MNKSLFVLAVVLVSSCVAFAQNGLSRRYQADPVTLHHELGSTQVSLFDVCLNGDTVELKAGNLSVCAKAITYQNGSTCLKSVVVTPTTPVVSAVSGCKYAHSNGGNECVPTHKMVNYAQPVAVAVYEIDSLARNSQSPLVTEYYVGTELYAIPACAR